MYLPEYDPENGGPKNKVEAWLHKLSAWIDAILHKCNVFIGTSCECGWPIVDDSTAKKCPRCGRKNGL